MANFEAIDKKMADEGLSPLIRASFKRSYDLLVNGDDGKISESEISLVEDLPDLETLPDHLKEGLSALDKAVVINLNGGLGTSMGLDKAKSLLPVKQNFSFLDVIAKQVIYLREEHSAKVPLLFMNSFNTEADTLEALSKIEKLSDGQGSIPFSFVQNKVPKILLDTLEAASYPEAPQLEWCPPGHGDIYTAISQTGLLQGLLDSGFKYAFIANADNLGASLDVNILGYFAKNNFPFLMEVADRTSADKKGGHLAKRKSDGQLLLREVAQCPDEDIDAFQDIDKYKYFNTNSLWVDLEALKNQLEKHAGVLSLPLIINKKNLDPKLATSPMVAQLETAMGAAIEVFKGATALRVPRSRFIPVKKTEDLLSLWSDRFILDEKGLVRKTSLDGKTIEVNLDDKYFKNIFDFEARFPKGAPSLKDCDSLTVKGDVIFGSDIVCQGEVSIEGEGKTISDGKVLTGEIKL